MLTLAQSLVLSFQRKTLLLCGESPANPIIMRTQPSLPPLPQQECPWQQAPCHLHPRPLPECWLMPSPSPHPDPGLLMLQSSNSAPRKGSCPICPFLVTLCMKVYSIMQRQFYTSIFYCIQVIAKQDKHIIWVTCIEIKPFTQGSIILGVHKCGIIPLTLLQNLCVYTGVTESSHVMAQHTY